MHLWLLAHWQVIAAMIRDNQVDAFLLVVSTILFRCYSDP
jgi:hypothetical protein